MSEAFDKWSDGKQVWEMDAEDIWDAATKAESTRLTAENAAKDEALEKENEDLRNSLHKTQAENEELAVVLGDATMTTLRKWKHRFTGKERSKLDTLTAYELGEVLRLGDGTKGLIQLRNDLVDGGGVILSGHKTAVLIEKAIAAHVLWAELRTCREALKGDGE